MHFAFCHERSSKNQLLKASHNFFHHLLGEAFLVVFFQKKHRLLIGSR